MIILDIFHENEQNRDEEILLLFSYKNKKKTIYDEILGSIYKQ